MTDLSADARERIREARRRAGDRRTALDRKILEATWKQDWLRLLPKLEEALIELIRLEELKHREQLRLPGILPTVPGLLISPKADGQPTTAEDIRRVIAFQTALFSDRPVMNAGGVYPSSLHLGWWRGF